MKKRGCPALFAGAAGLSFLLFAPAAHAALADDLCGAAQIAAAPPPAALTAAAASAEAALARGSYDAALQAISFPVSDTTAPDKQALASYCTAAGELMRVAPVGSQYQAQTYLVSAFRYSEQASDRRVSSVAAYRLGLVSLSAPSIAGTRGQRRSRGGTAAAVRDANASQAVADDSVCGELDSPGIADQSNSYISWIALECAQQRATLASDPELAARADLRLARLGVMLGDSAAPGSNDLRSKAADRALAGFAAASRVADPRRRAELIGRLLEARLDLGRPGDAAAAIAVDEMRRAAPNDTANLAFASALEGRIALAASNGPAAAGALRQAIFLESQRAQPFRLADWYALLADADPANGRAHALAAYRALEAVRPLLPRTDPLTEESVFELRMRRVFEKAADAQLAAAPGVADPVLIARAQEIVETYRQAEIQSSFGSECVPAREPIKPGELRPGEILLYPILLPGRVELLYADGSDGSGAQYRRLPVNSDANRASVDRLVEEMVLQVQYEGDAWRAPAQRLYELLIAPIASRLDGDRSTLIVVPDGPLRALPFAALLAPDGRFLVQQTRVAIAPSLAYSQPGRPSDGRALNVVAASLQKEVALPSGTFSKLEGVGEEARIAAGGEGGGRMGRLITDFGKADLVRALAGQRVDVLHLATHAAFNGRSDRAFIVADDETIPIGELRALIAQNRTRGDELDLLVLSACETAVGDDEASMGLAGAAVQSGATSAVASLWQVNDAATVDLMRTFYTSFRGGASKADSLRNAQLSLIGKGGDTAAPYNWAAFILLGAWR